VRPLLLILATIVAVAAGCGGGGDDAQRLDILAYPGYAEDGTTDARADWVTPFEREAGCDVHVRVVRSATELLTLVTNRAYDVASVSGDITLALVGGREVLPLDLARVAAYRTIYPALRRLPHALDHGRVYGVPHGRSAQLLLWRADLVSTPDAFALRFADRIVSYDTAMQIAEAAIRLGLQNPYELDRSQFLAAVRLAAKHRTLVGRYWQDDVQALADFTGGNVVVGLAPPLLAAELRRDEVPVRTRPALTTGRADVWMIPRRVRHLDCAYRWLNWILSPRVNAQSARYLDAAPATPRACAYMNCARVRANDERFWSRIAFWTTPRHDCGDARGSVCADWFDWQDAWGFIRR
jgi:putative spermidine/putrescine transport system substrate-binding protein